MTKDPYRKYQKQLCYRTSLRRGKRGIYGCSCCRTISDLNHFKVFGRKYAKGKLRQETRDEIRAEITSGTD